MSILNSETVKYYGYTFPFWATFGGWCFTLSSISAIPIYASYYYFSRYYLGKGQQNQKEPVQTVLQMLSGGACKTDSTTTTSASSMMLKNNYITGAGE